MFELLLLTKFSFIQLSWW